MAKTDPLKYLQRRAQEQWNESFDRLVYFKRMRGHFQIPQSGKAHTSLAKWTQSQRSNRDSLHPSQLKLLDSIQFPWNDDEEESQGSSEYETANEYDTADEML